MMGTRDEQRWGGCEKSESRSTLHRSCPDNGSVDSSEGISTLKEAVTHELRLNFKVIVVIAEPMQTEELEVRDGELSMMRVRGEVKVGV